MLGLLANVTLRGAFVGAGLLLLPAVLLYLWIFKKREAETEREIFYG